MTEHMIVTGELYRKAGSDTLLLLKVKGSINRDHLWLRGSTIYTDGFRGIANGTRVEVEGPGYQGFGDHLTFKRVTNINRLTW